MRSPSNLFACSVNSSPYNELIETSIFGKTIFLFETPSFCHYLLHLYIVLQRYFLGFFHIAGLNHYNSGGPFLASSQFACNSQNIFFSKMFLNILKTCISVRLKLLSIFLIPKNRLFQAVTLVCPVKIKSVRSRTMSF